MNRKTFLKSVGLGSIPLFMNSLYSLENFSKNFKLTERMPVLFIGHGSPMNAIEDNTFVRGFKTIAKTLPKPNAILCISAHWYTKGTKVTAMELPKTIHDFGGFPDELFQVNYPAAGSPELANTIQSILKPIKVDLDMNWGLDHGAWSVLKHLYPQADIPVIQMSIDYTKPASYHFELANRLSELRNRGVLILGSGNIIHNLGLIDFNNINTDNFGYDWAIEAHSIFNKLIVEGNYAPLLDYNTLGKAVQLSIPTPEHYLPLLYTLGLQRKGEELMLFNDKLQAGSLSMTSVKIS